LVELLNIRQNLSNSAEFISLNPANARVNLSLKSEVRLGKVYRFIEKKCSQEIEYLFLVNISKLTIPAF